MTTENCLWSGLNWKKNNWSLSAIGIINLNLGRIGYSQGNHGKGLKVAAKVALPIKY
ncbi:MAG: hypothetical protein WC147_09955 [Syntrophomonas sp.]